MAGFTVSSPNLIRNVDLFPVLRSDYISIRNLWGEGGGIYFQNKVKERDKKDEYEKREKCESVFID